MKSRSMYFYTFYTFCEVSGSHFNPRYEDMVVQDNFKFGDDKEIVSVSLASLNSSC